MTEIVITAGGVTLPARLAPTVTARTILRHLPLYLTAVFWGRVIELDVHVEAYREKDAVVLAKPGQLLYAPERDDILIPYGSSPISRGTEIRLHSPSNVWGQIIGDVQKLREVPDGALVTMALAAHRL